MYLSVDWERNVFNISQAVFNSPPLALDIVTIEPVDNIAELIPQSEQSGNILSIGTIVGIVVGALCLILFAAFGCWGYLRRQRRKEISGSQSEDTGDLSTDGKEVLSTRPGLPLKHKVKTQNDLELEGLPIREMYVPYEHHGSAEHKQASHFTGLVEADSVAPIYELPTTIHELSASNVHKRKPV